MRLEAGTPIAALKWCVWHAEWCKVLKLVKWIDDETMQWEQYITPYAVVNGVVSSEVHQAKKIIIDKDALLVTINPIEGVMSCELKVSEEVTCGAH